MVLIYTFMLLSTIFLQLYSLQVHALAVNMDGKIQPPPANIQIIINQHYHASTEDLQLGDSKIPNIPDYTSTIESVFPNEAILSNVSNLPKSSAIPSETTPTSAPYPVKSITTAPPKKTLVHPDYIKPTGIHYSGPPIVPNANVPHRHPIFSNNYPCQNC